MKTALIFTAFVLAMLLATVAFASDTTESSTQMLIGARYDNNGGVTMTIGGIKNIGGNFYVLGYGDMGTGQNSASLEPAFIITKGKLNFGVLLGANSDWEPQATDEDLINYLVFAGGVIGGYTLSDDLQAWATYKRKEPPKGNLYEGLNLFGLGLAFRF